VENPEIAKLPTAARQRYPDQFLPCHTLAPDPGSQTQGLLLPLYLNSILELIDSGIVLVGNFQSFAHT